MYTLDAVVVEADRTKNKFGDTITEQSYYRTGGDVKVITREEIDKRHYNDLTDAIKRIPGVTFQRPGYRGGEYGYSSFNNGVAINGDFRVIILVDGRRVDNSTSTRAGSYSYASNKGTGVNLDEVTNIDNVDKIEVIKGPGASVYGSDAMGGVINIITRKGGEKPTGTVDLSTGSVDQHNYSVTYSGSAGDDNSLHYFISANRTMSGDTEYRDGWYHDTKGTLSGSRYRDNGVNIRVDKDFGAERNLKIWYNHKDGWDGYPIATPALKYYNEKDWKKIAFQLTTGVLDKSALSHGVYKLTNGADKPTQQEDWYGNKLFDKNGNPLWNEAQGADGKWYAGLGWSNDTDMPGYHNMFMVDSGIYGSYNQYRSNDLDVVYTFKKDNGMDSFIRYYDQSHYYAGKDDYKWGYIMGPDGKPLLTDSRMPELTQDFLNRFPNGATEQEFNQWTNEHNVPFPEGSSSLIDDWLNKTGGKAGRPDRWHKEQNRGFQLQYAKSFGIHDIIGSATYDKAKTYQYSINDDGTISSSHVQRKTVRTYVQDKMHLTDKWDFTPALRYTWYSSYENSKTDGTHTTVNNSTDTSFDYTLNTEYMFNDSTSMYLGWTRIYRPIKAGDYITGKVGGYYTVPYPLQSERGNAWTLGIRKDLTDNMTLSINYDWTKMSNAIANLPIYDASGHQSTLAMNAKEDKQSFNITLDSRIGDHWTVSAAYDHMKDDWKAKDGVTLPDNWQSMAGSDVNVGINNIRPQNHYSLNIAYENGKWYSGILANLYTGMNTKYFSDNQFFIVDWNLNYEVSDAVTLYAVIENLTNAAYEITALKGGYSANMPSRSYLFGVKYKF